jgi:excisionase family DNA binding protein
VETRFVLRQLTVKQSALELNVSISTIRAWIASRKLGHVKLGRSVRIPLEEIERLIQRGTVNADDNRNEARATSHGNTASGRR